MADDPLGEQPEQWAGIADQISAGVLKNLPLDKIRDMVIGGSVQAHHGRIAAAFELLEFIAALVGKGLVGLEEPFLPVIAAFVAPIVAGLFGTEADVATFASRGNREGRGQVAASLVDAYMAAITGGTSGEIPPGDEGAKRIAGAAVHAALEGSFQALITELCSDIIPFEIGHFDQLRELPDEIISALGVSRLVRRAFAPLVDATAATPMKWKVAKDYRQNLHAPSDAVALFLRARWTAAQLNEELARQGYSDDRIDDLVNLHQKLSSLDDNLTLMWEGVWARGQVLQKLTDDGWDNGTAELVVSAAEIRRRAGIRDDAVAAIKAAYVDRRIDDGELAGYLDPIYPNADDKQAHVVTMQTARALNTRRLTSGQVETCVKAKVLNIGDYRAALEREGYPDDDVTALELLLETQLNATADVEQLKQKKADAAAAAQKVKDDAAAAKELELEQAAALKRRGSPAALKDAAVRGLIPIGRYAEVLAPDYDADTVQIMVDAAQSARDAYLTQQQKADDAEKRAALKHVDVAAYKSAVLEGLLTVDQFRQALDGSTVAPADVDVILAVLQKQKADRDAAQQQRDAAAAKAKIKHIDLAMFEQLVRRGHRTIGEYRTLLGDLGYDEASQAAIVELLQLKVVDDGEAAQLRAAAAATKDVKGLTLEQLRRAVILGTSTVDAFQTWLVQNKYTSDAQAVLVAELRAAVAEADAARAKRDDEAKRRVQPPLPLATVERAARLGVVSPDVYAARLRADGYTDDDVAIDLDLLAVEIADVQAQRARAAAAQAKADDPGLTLAELATAVKLGVSSLDEYHARAVELHYAADDVDTLVAVLTDEAQTARAAQARHDAIGAQLQTKNLSLSELDQAVLKGLMTLDAYATRVQSYGYDSADTELLAELLQLQLDAAAAKVKP